MCIIEYRFICVTYMKTSYIYIYITTHIICNKNQFICTIKITLTFSFSLYIAVN